MGQGIVWDYLEFRVTGECKIEERSEGFEAEKRFFCVFVCLCWCTVDNGHESEKDEGCEGDTLWEQLRLEFQLQLGLEGGELGVSHCIPVESVKDAIISFMIFWDSLLPPNALISENRVSKIPASIRVNVIYINVYVWMWCGCLLKMGTMMKFGYNGR